MVRLAVVLALCTWHSMAVAQVATPAEPVGPRSTAAAIESGIAWLLAHQEESGGWSASQFQRHDPKGDLCTGTGKPDQDLHVTALVTCALLLTGSTERVGPHRQPLQKALAWLQAQQQKDGFFGAPEASNAVEAHALVCRTIVWSKRCSGLPMPAEGLARLAALRLPDGTWPARLGEAKGDAMATYWASLASRSSLAEVDLEPTLAAVVEGKLAAPMLPSTEAMLRWMAPLDPKDDARLADCLDKLAEQPPNWRTGADAARMDFLDWHLGIEAMFREGGTAWQQWYRRLLETLVPHQRTDGAHAGSWDPVDARGQQGGRVYATAVNVTSLLFGQNTVGAVFRAGPAKKK